MRISLDIPAEVRGVFVGKNSPLKMSVEMDTGEIVALAESGVLVCQCAKCSTKREPKSGVFLVLSGVVSCCPYCGGDELHIKEKWKRPVMALLPEF